jgi:hypothetical protein
MKEKWERKKDGLETIGASIWGGMDVSSSLLRLRRSIKKTDDGWVVVMQLRHRVEKVGDEACAVAGGATPG